MLKQVWQAATPAPFLLWDGTPPVMNAGYVVPPRIYAEDLYTYGQAFGALFSLPDPVPGNPARICYFTLLGTITHEGAAVVRFDWSSADGTFLGKLYATSWTLGNIFGRVTAEPDGTLWLWGTPDAPGYLGGAAFDPNTFQTTGPTISQVDYVAGGPYPTNVFGVDQSANIVVADWGGFLDNGAFYFFDFRTKAKIATAWLPRTVTQVVSVMMTGSFVYITDTWGWLHIYSYAGAYYGSLLNRLDSLPTITLSGYDPISKRVYSMAMSQPNADGSSTLRPVGCYEIPAPTAITAPIPLQVPRTQRDIILWSRLHGDGMEACASNRGSLTGTIAKSFVSSAQGDILIPVTPTVDGEFDATVTT